MERIIDLGSAKLPLTDVGVGLPVVLLHAGVTDRRSWAGLLSAAENSLSTYRFIAYDRRGFGAASWLPESHSPISDLIAVLNDCRATNSVIIGNSQGGRLAIDLALTRPDLVSGLVLVGAAVSGAPSPTEHEQAQIRALIDSIDEAEAAENLELVNELECRLWLEGPGNGDRMVGDLRWQFLRMNDRVLRAPKVGETGWATDSWARLETLNVPTLIVVGELDLPHIVSRSEEMARRIPGATLIKVPNTAHLVAFEDPVGFAALLTQFLTARLFH